MIITQLYQNIILKNPKLVFIALLIALFSFGYFSKDFRLDASSETLLIEGDPDLKYLQEISERYGSKEFLILTYTPKDGMVTDSSINNLLSLKYKIQSLDWVHSVVTLLDIPLLDNSDAPLQERLESFWKRYAEDLCTNDWNTMSNFADMTLYPTIIPGWKDNAMTEQDVINNIYNITNCTLTNQN